jgi:LEA14-like dessication related protein
VISLLLLGALLLASPSAAPAPTPSALSLTLEPGPGETFTAVVVGPPGEGGGTPGDFRGRIALYGSPAAIPVTGRAERTRSGRIAVRFAVRYAAVPADWSARFRPLSVDLALDGSCAGRRIDWRARVPFDEIAMSADASTGSRFLSLSQIRLTDVAFAHSEGVADLRVRNPFTFPLTIASSEYRIEAAGREVGGGSTRGILVRPSRTSVVQFPVEVENGPLVAAAGRAILAAGDVEARLRGWIRVRLAGGDVRIPVDLGGRLRNDT